MQSSSASGDESITGINVTPLVDVVLVLLVVLMVTATYLASRSIPVDLSSRPSPPALGTSLERNYPAEARRRGLSGTAKVRARIDPDGVVRQVTLLQESAQGFGSACSRTLSGSRWAAPKDRAGHSVATEIRYTCRFVVDP